VKIFVLRVRWSNIFTGIIEEIGVVKKISRQAVSVELAICSNLLEDVKIGDSIATNGVCLTVTSIQGNEFYADVMHETLNKSSLGYLKVHDEVNLERAMRLDDRLNGHIVSGHIDGTGKISSIKKDGIAYLYTIKTDRDILKYIIFKGSITIDGISLTVTNVDRESFTVSIIPHSLTNTILKNKRIGSIVNLENDLFGKYVEKLFSHGVGNNTKNDDKNDKGSSSGKITREYLLKNGF